MRQDECEMKEDEGSLKLAAGTKDGHSGASASASARIKRGEMWKEGVEITLLQRG